MIIPCEAVAAYYHENVWKMAYIPNGISFQWIKVPITMKKDPRDL